MRSKIFCYLSSLLKHIDETVQNYKSVCCIIWMLNSVSHVEGGMWAEDAQEKVLRKISGPKKCLEEIAY